MSPNPGEPEHERRGWTHAICDACYFQRARARGWAAHPTRAGFAIHDSVACCYCGQPTRGIYVRQAAAEVHGV